MASSACLGLLGKAYAIHGHAGSVWLPAPPKHSTREVSTATAGQGVQASATCQAEPLAASICWCAIIPTGHQLVPTAKLIFTAVMLFHAGVSTEPYCTLLLQPLQPENSMLQFMSMSVRQGMLMSQQPHTVSLVKVRVTRQGSKDVSLQDSLEVTLLQHCLSR